MEPEKSYKLKVIVTITIMTIVANVLGDIALFWPENGVRWAQLIASRISSGLITLTTLWALSDPVVGGIVKPAGNNRVPQPAQLLKKFRRVASNVFGDVACKVINCVS